MNIYKLKKDGGNHIGKRFANGIWCWDCRIKAERDVMGLFWYCTKCGQRTSDKTLSNPAFRELGFDKSKETKKVGVNGAAGFIWHGKDKKDVTSVYSRFAKEGAKYHIGMVYSTQSPTTILGDLLAQTENFFIAHLSSQEEVEALARLNVAYSGLKADILTSKTPGYVRMLTHSHRFVVPVQALKFSPASK